MNNILSFGKYAGKTFEWLFFNDPSYAEYIYNNGIHRQRHNFSEEECGYFLELFNRACHLRTTCRKCKERPATRISMSLWERSEASNHIGFYCDECEHAAEGLTVYASPSFLAGCTLSDDMQQHLAKCIKNNFIERHVPLTQAKMEEFFQKDENFVDATPGFFTRDVAVV